MDRVVDQRPPGPGGSRVAAGCIGRLAVGRGARPARAAGAGSGRGQWARAVGGMFRGGAARYHRAKGVSTVPV